MINNLFKSKGIMVDREEEYLPVVTEKSEYNWKNAYKEYQDKVKKYSSPFYDRLHPPGMLESLIRNDETEHNNPN